ncbi:MAG: hypothetical protein WC913_10660, partial [Desulfuromonas sp.]
VDLGVREGEPVCLHRCPEEGTDHFFKLGKQRVVTRGDSKMGFVPGFFIVAKMHTVFRSTSPEGGDYFHDGGSIDRRFQKPAPLMNH